MPMPFLSALLLALCADPAAMAAPGVPAAAERQARSAALPAGMQGHWADREDPATRLVIAGGEVIYAGRTVAYDTKLVERRDGALIVRLAIDDPAEEDAFQRRSVTGLVLSPAGELFAYNVKFASQFVRVAAP